MVALIVGILFCIGALLIAIGLGDWFLESCYPLADEKKEKRRTIRRRLIICLLFAAFGTVSILASVGVFPKEYYSLAAILIIVPVTTLFSVWNLR